MCLQSLMKFHFCLFKILKKDQNDADGRTEWRTFFTSNFFMQMFNVYVKCQIVSAKNCCTSLFPCIRTICTLTKSISYGGGTRGVGGREKGGRERGELGRREKGGGRKEKRGREKGENEGGRREKGGGRREKGEWRREKRGREKGTPCTPLLMDYNGQ